MYSKGYESNTLISREYQISKRSLRVFQRLDSEINDKDILKARREIDCVTLKLLDKEKQGPM